MATESTDGPTQGDTPFERGDSAQTDAPDRGLSPEAAPPLSPEEYAELQRDAREEKPTDGHPEALREKHGHRLQEPQDDASAS